MLGLARKHPVWADRAAIKARYAAKGQVYGTGMAMSLQAYGTSGDGMVASVEMDTEGNITVASDAVDMGNGSATTLATVVGKILGRNASSITMGGYQLFSETGLKDPYGGAWNDPTWTAKGVGSSSACLTPEQTAWVSGFLTYLPGGKTPLAQADLAKWNLANMAASGKYDIFGLKRLEIDGLSIKSSLGGGWKMLPRQNTIAPKGNPRAGRYAYAPAVNLIGLIVDNSSGHVQVENAVTVLNAGRIHVEPLVSSQAQGGLAMALGWALLEICRRAWMAPRTALGTSQISRARYRDLPLNTAYVESQRSQELILLPANGDAPGRGIAEAVMSPSPPPFPTPCTMPPAPSSAAASAFAAPAPWLCKRRATAFPSQ